ncbi:MAG: PP0621 family protein [Gallionella sp.]|jgi:uncharacterized protein
MSRLIFLFAIAAVVYLLLKSYRKSAPKQAEEKSQAEDMVRCAHCGVHLPIGEAVRSGEQQFCCAAHRDAHRK